MATKQETTTYWLERAKKVNIENSAIPSDAVIGVHVPELVQMVLSAEAEERAKKLTLVPRCADAAKLL